MPDAAPKKRVAKSARLRSLDAMILHRNILSRTARHHTRILSGVEKEKMAQSKHIVRSAIAGTLLVVCTTIGVVIAQQDEEQEPQRVLFIAENDAGKVWANLTLTLQRTAEPYLPMVVAVENMSSSSITIDRQSFWLSDLDDIFYFMPTVKEVRKNYDKIVMDYRMVSYAGIPWENWRWTSRLEFGEFLS